MFCPLIFIGQLILLITYRKFESLLVRPGNIFFSILIIETILNLRLLATASNLSNLFSLWYYRKSGLAHAFFFLVFLLDYCCYISTVYLFALLLFDSVPMLCYFALSVQSSQKYSILFIQNHQLFGGFCMFWSHFFLSCLRLFYGWKISWVWAIKEFVAYHWQENLIGI